MANFKSYVEGWKKKLKEEQKETDKKFQLSRELAKKCAKILQNEYDVETVYLIGSAVHKTRFHQQSDIDLAVEGLEPSYYYSALSDCWSELPPELTLDIMPIEDLEDNLREPLLSRGIKLEA